MASLQSILTDPNYVNANPATKAAIFDKYAPLDPNYSNANKETQNAIRVKFGLESPASESRQNVAAEPERRGFFSLPKNLAEAKADLRASPFGQLSMGTYRGLKDITDTLVKSGASALDYISPQAVNELSRREQINALADADLKRYEQLTGDSTMAGVGRVGGQVLGTLPVGGVLGSAASKIPGVSPTVVNAIKSGGFDLGVSRVAPAGVTTNILKPTVLTKAADLGTRALGGAITGGVSAGLINPEEAETGAYIGAALPTVAAPVVKGLAKVGGKAYDLVTGKLGDVEAAKLAREMAGKQINAIRAANGAAPIDITTAQATANIDNDVWQAFLNAVQGQDKNAVFSSLKTKAKQDQLAILANLAGGANQTEAAGARKATSKALNALTLPMQEQNLLAANMGKTTIAPLQTEAQAARQMAAEKVGDVRRFTAAQGRAVNPATENLASDYMLGKLAGSADEVAGKAAAESLNYGQVARTAEEKLAHLAEQGIQPLDVSKVTSTLRKFANQTGTRADDVQVKVYSKLADQIDALTNRAGGVMDVNDLYQIRKTGINDAIQEVLGPNATGQEKRIAELLGQVRPLIDDAIEKAGGKTWRDYLSTHAAGMKQIEQMELAAKVMDMYSKSPKEFIEIVKGNNPKVIRDIFGPGNEDIFKEMGSKMVKLQKVAGEVERDVLAIPERIAAGREALKMTKPSWSSKIPGFVGYKTALIKKFAQIEEGKLNEKTMGALIKAAENGKNMNELLATVPAEERVKILKVFRNPSQWDSFVTTGGVASGIQNPNSLAPETENRNALVK